MCIVLLDFSTIKDEAKLFTTFSIPYVILLPFTIKCQNAIQ